MLRSKKQILIFSGLFLLLFTSFTAAEPAGVFETDSFTKIDLQKHFRRLDGKKSLPVLSQEDLEAKLNRLLKELERAQSVKERIKLLDQIGSTYKELKIFRKAIESYRAALAILPPANEFNQGALLYNIGDSYLELKEPETATQYLNQAIELWRPSGNFSYMAIALLNLGEAYRRQGYLEKALDSYKESKRFYNEARDFNSEASVLAIMGSVTFSPEESLLYYSQAQQIWEKQGDPVNQAAMFDAIAGVYSDLDKDEQSVASLELAEKVWESAKEPTAQAKTLLDIGINYVWLNKPDKALESFKKAFGIYQSLNNKSGMAEAYTRMGWLYYFTKDDDKSIENFNKAASLWQEVNELTRMSVAFAQLGIIYARRGKKQEALAIAERVGLFGKQLDFLYPSKPLILYNAGLINLLAGNFEQALRYWQLEVEVYRKRSDKKGEAQALNSIAYAYDEKGQFEKALNFYKLSLDARETVRASTRVEELKIGLDNQSINSYIRAVALAFKTKQPALAFELSEKARARTFLDQIGNVRVDLSQTAAEGLIRQEKSLLQEINLLEKEIQKENAKLERDEQKLIEINRQLVEKRRKYENIITQIKVGDPRYASIKTVETLKFYQVQKLLDKNTTLISFFLTDDGTIAFIISQNSFDAVKLQVSEDELIEGVQEWMDFSNLQGSPPVLARLYKQLFEPLKSYIKTPVIGIIPHGAIHYVPFAALFDGTKYLNESYTFFNLPSTSVLRFVLSDKKAQNPTLLALAQSRAEGQPFLKSVDKEVESITNLFPKPRARSFFSSEASETVFRDNAGQFNYVLLAAHATLNSENPLFSRIYLGADKLNDGHLQVREIYNLNLKNTNMIVLSACETQLGTQSRGDEIIGVNRAFFYAGAQTLIASLWDVDDDAAQIFMTTFFTHLEQGTSKAKAFREAQINTKRLYKKHPYYWAAFILTGNPR